MTEHVFKSFGEFDIPICLICGALEAENNYPCHEQIKINKTHDFNVYDDGWYECSVCGCLCPPAPDGSSGIPPYADRTCSEKIMDEALS